VVGGALLVAGCGAPPQPEQPAGPTSPPATSGTSAPSAPGPAPGLPGGPPPGPEDPFAVDCAGEPDQTDVVDLLRAEGLLEAGSEVRVVTGPLCAGDWQYAVVAVPDLDPLQVVTRGEAGALELVTAGTDVCTVEVRIQAPVGIRDAAACGA
jgi:hypothetical protein